MERILSSKLALYEHLRMKTVLTVLILFYFGLSQEDRKMGMTEQQRNKVLPSLILVSATFGINHLNKTCKEQPSIEEHRKGAL